MVGIGNTASGVTPLSGFGTRFMWIPAKAAIRGGNVGARAGYNNTSGFRNALIGDSANVLVSNLNAATAIGYLSKVSASNTIILGDTFGYPQVCIGVTAVGKTLSGTKFEIGSGTPSFMFQRATGTLASPTTVSSTGALGRLDFYGYEGANWDQAASIIVEGESTINTNIVPAKIRFITQSGIGSLAERMRITRNGNVSIGQAGDVDTRLYVDGGVTIEPGTTVSLTADNQTVNVGNESYIRLNSAAATGSIRTIILSNGRI